MAKFNHIMTYTYNSNESLQGTALEEIKQQLNKLSVEPVLSYVCNNCCFSQKQHLTNGENTVQLLYDQKQINHSPFGWVLY